MTTFFLIINLFFRFPLLPQPPATACVSSREDLLAAHALASLPLLTTDSVARSAARRALRSATTSSPAAARSLVAALARATKGMATAKKSASLLLPSSDAALLGGWAAMAARGLSAEDAAKAAPALASLHASLLLPPSLSSSAVGVANDEGESKRRRRRARGCSVSGVAAALRARPELFDAYVAAASSSPALAAAVARATATAGEKEKAPPPPAAHVARLLDAALAARDPAVAADSIEALTPAIRAMSVESLTSGPFPVAARAVKRSAEAGLSALSALLRATSPERFDLGGGDAAGIPAALPKELVDAAIPGLKAPNDAVVAAAEGALAALAARVSDGGKNSTAVAATFADAVLSALGLGSGSGGESSSAQQKPRAATERAALARGAAALSPVGRAAPEVASRAAGALAAAAESEANDDARREALLAARAWASSSPSGALPPALLSTLASFAAASGKEGGAARSDALRSCARLLSSSSSASAARGSAASVLLAPLAKAAAEGAAKPAGRADGIAAAAAGVSIVESLLENGEGEGGGGEDASALRSVLCPADKSECSLLVPSGLSKLSSDDAELTAALCGDLLKPKVLQWLSESGGAAAASPAPAAAAAAAASRALAALALHASARVRRAALSSIRAAVLAGSENSDEKAASTTTTTAAAATDLLLESLWLWQASAAAGRPPGSAEGGEGPAAVPAGGVQVADRIQSALRSLLVAVVARGEEKRASSLSPASAARLLLSAHHPTAVAARRGSAGSGSTFSSSSAAWRAVVGGRGTSIKTLTAVASALEADPRASVAALMEAARAGDAGARAAALGALPAAVRAAAAEASSSPSSSSSSSFDSLWRALIAALSQATERKEHDALTDDEVKIFHTPEGELALEAKVTVPSGGNNGFSSHGGGAVAIGKRAADSGKVSSSSPTAGAAAAPPPSISRSSFSSSASKPSKSGFSASLGVKKNAAAVWLEQQLEAEAQVRVRVASVAAALARGLAAVGAVAGGAPEASSRRLSDLSPLVSPLLASRVVAGEARDAAVGLAMAALLTPSGAKGVAGGGGGGVSPSFACAPAGAADALEIAARGGAAPAKGTQAMGAIVSLGKAARRSSSSSKPSLPRPAAALLLPALAHVLRSKPAKGSISAAAMQAAALDAAEALARDHARGARDAGEYARVLYAALEKMPGEGDRLAPLLAELATRGSGGGGGEGEGGDGDGANVDASAASSAETSVPSAGASSSSAADERGLAGMLAGLRSGAPAVRRSALTALGSLPALSAAASSGVASLPAGAAATLWAARWDPDAANATAARAAWDNASGSGSASSPPPAGLVEPLVAALAEAAAGERADLVVATASGIADYLLQRCSLDDTCVALDALLALGSAEEGGVEDARRRRAAAEALGASAKALSLDQAAAVVEWLLRGPIADEEAGDSWVEAGSSVVRGAGAADASSSGSSSADSSDPSALEAAAAKAAERLIPVIEAGVTAASKTTGGDEHAADALRAGGAALLGAAAAGLPKGDARVSSVADALLDVLRIPSAAVQKTAADALPALVPRLAGGEQAQRQLVEKLLKRATAGRDYGERRGGALGAAAAVKGAGLSAVNGFGVLAFVKSALSDEKDPRAREGGTLLFEALAERLGRLFEPYVVSLLPALLDRLADNSAPAREAAEAAARAVTSGLTSQGVKMCLPSLLDAAAPGRAWRTQAGAISALGAMAHCAPKQLATALPVVVPRLSDALADPHPKVSAASRGALQEVGSVVRNPEVRALAPVLLSALAETGSGAGGAGGGGSDGGSSAGSGGGAGVAALDALLATTFVNAVDAASLALVAPVLLRGLRDRSGDAKQRAARVAGAMACLVAEPKDIEPYVPLLLPALRGCLADPLPAVRAAAARALGSLLRGVGEGGGLLGDLLPWLMDSLHAGASSVERSGAAQGLAEVLAVLGPKHVEALLPSVLAGCRSKSPAAREGSLALFRFLPTAMPDAFRSHLDEVLPAVLGGLADDSEGVRSAALAAARTAVDLYASEELEALLPAVESGATAANWRIRQSSVELLGDLLFRVSGIGGRARADGGGATSSAPAPSSSAPSSAAAAAAPGNDDEQEGHAVEAHGAAITAALGPGRRAEVLGLLYLCRSDVAQPVRGAALHVWKSVVANTPRTLSEVLPSIFDAGVAALASGVEDRAATAGRCLGELVCKLGERALERALPRLVEALSSPPAEGAASSSPPAAATAAAATRRGAALGLREVIDASPRLQMAGHSRELAAALQGSLADPDAGVRSAAGAAFGALFRGGAGPSPSSSPSPAAAGGERRGGGRDRKGGGGGDRGEAPAAGGGGGGGGGPLLDGVLPGMLDSLRGPEPGASQALEGLRVLLGVRPGALSSVVPRLLARAQRGDAAGGASACRALGSLAPSVAGPGLHSHLGSIVPALLRASALEEGEGEEEENNEGTIAAAPAAIDAVAAATGEDGVHLLLGALEAGLAADSARGRAAAASALGRYAASQPRVDLSDALPRVLASLVALLAESGQPRVLEAARGALKSVGAALLATDGAASSHARALREAVADAVKAVRVGAAAAAADEEQGSSSSRSSVVLPGLLEPGALAPLLPIYLQGVLRGSAELREVAADGLAELMRASSPLALKPHVVAVAGPLIRVVGDRFPAEVRRAVLRALGVLLEKGGAGLRPFVPQLQTTFVRGLGDAADRGVRHAAAVNLGALAALSARADALVRDLAAGADACPPGGERPPAGAAGASGAGATPTSAVGGAEPVLTALCGALASAAGPKLSADAIKAAARASARLLASAGALLVDNCSASASLSSAEAVVAAAAAAFGAAVALLPPDEASLLLDEGPLAWAAVSASSSSAAKQPPNLWSAPAAASALAAVARRASAPVLSRIEGGGARAAAAALSLARATPGGGSGSSLSSSAAALTRVAAARAAGYLATAEAVGDLPKGSALGKSSDSAALALATLVSPDQDSDVIRAAMASIRRAAVGKSGADPDAGPDVLKPFLPDLAAPLCGILAAAAAGGGGSGPVKLAAERTLVRLLRADAGSDRAVEFLASSGAGPLAKTWLGSEAVRRMGRLPLDDEADGAADFGEP